MTTHAMSENEKEIYPRKEQSNSYVGEDGFTQKSIGQLNTKPDSDVWDLFRSGDELALTYIYQSYADKMYNYGCQFTDKHELVSDCIQELFTEIISKRKKLGKTASIKFYLYKSLRRKLFKLLKKENRLRSKLQIRAAEGFNILEDASVKFIDQEFSSFQKKIITEECNLLPVRQKEAIMLYFYEGFSYQEIAQTLGLTRTKSARALVYRSVDSLSVRLKKYKHLLYPLLPLLLTTQLQ